MIPTSKGKWHRLHAALWAYADFSRCIAFLVVQEALLEIKPSTNLTAVGLGKRVGTVTLVSFIRSFNGIQIIRTIATRRMRGGIGLAGA